LDETDLSESYKRNLMMCVRTFYNENDIEIPRTFRTNSRSDRKKPLLLNDLPTMEDIKHILKYSNNTFRAIILLGVSSGMSRAEICSLTFKDFFDAIKLDTYHETLQELVVKLEQIDNLIPLWQIRRIKTGTNFFTFNTPEASDAIKDYLIDLNRISSRFEDTAKLKSEFKFSPKNKLFVNSHLNPMSPYNMSRIFVKLNIKAGFEKVDGKIYVRPHTLRKLFASTLEKNKMPHLMIRWIMGHELDQTTGSYFKADPIAVKEEYIQIVTYLTVNTNEEAKPITIEGYDQLIEDSKHKDKKLKALEEQVQEMIDHNKERNKLLDEIIHDKKVMGNILK
jgi:integrase